MQQELREQGRVTTLSRDRKVRQTWALKDKKVRSRRMHEPVLKAWKQLVCLDHRRPSREGAPVRVVRKQGQTEVDMPYKRLPKLSKVFLRRCGWSFTNSPISNQDTIKGKSRAQHLTPKNLSLNERQLLLLFYQELFATEKKMQMNHHTMRGPGLWFQRAVWAVPGPKTPM